jgi:hypothetical protein
MGQFEGPSLMALGAGISSGHPEQGFADMAKMQQGYQQDYAAEAEQDRIRQQTMQYMIQNGFDPQQAEAASQNPDILRHIFQLEEEKARLKTSTAASGAYGTPQWAQDDQGKWVQYVIGRDGKPMIIDPGQGLHAVPPYDIAGSKAAGAVFGKDVETARLQIIPAQMAAEDVHKMSDSVLNDPYLDHMFGTIDMTGGWLSKADLPNLSPESSRVMGNLKRLMGQSFIQARQMLKGGGQITDYEGTKADQAYQTIGAAKTVPDLKAAIQEFQYWVDRGVEKLQRTARTEPNQGGQGGVPVTPAVVPPSLNPTVQPPAGGGGGGRVPTYNPATGKVE